MRDFSFLSSEQLWELDAWADVLDDVFPEFDTATDEEIKEWLDDRIQDAVDEQTQADWRLSNWEVETYDS